MNEVVNEVVNEAVNEAAFALATLRAHRRFRSVPPSRGALVRLQERRFARLLPKLRALPFYRDAGERLEELPILDRRAQREHFADLNSLGLDYERARALADTPIDSELSYYTFGTSSGTSGERGVFIASEPERALFAGAMLAKLLPGRLLSPRRDRVALFLRTGSRLYSGVRSARLRFEYFPLERDLARARARLRALAPTILIGPPSMLRRLARDWRGPRPTRVYSTAERLDEVDATALRAVFGGRLHQIYQASEGHLGQTCPRGTLHLNEDLLIVEREILDDTRFSPILTDLHRTTQPIVRMRSSDILSEIECDCGSPFLAVHFHGRREESFRTTREVGPSELRSTIERFPVRDYRVRQTSPHAGTLWVEPPELFPQVAAALHEIRGIGAGFRWSMGERPNEHPAQKVQRIGSEIRT